MGASGKSVKGPDPEGRMAMGVAGIPGLRRMGVAGTVEMHVAVRRPVMDMLVGVDLEAEGLPHAPDADADEKRSDKPLAQRRDLPEGKDVTEGDGKDTDEEDSGRMPDSPPHSRDPRPPMATDRQGRDSRQVVRSGEDMQETGKQTGEHGKHCRRGYGRSRVAPLKSGPATGSTRVSQSGSAFKSKLDV